MLKPTPTRPSEEHFERRDAARQEQFAQNGSYGELKQIRLDQDTFGGALDAFAFPVIVAATSILLGLILSVVAVQLDLHLAPDYFITICTALVTLTALPLAVVSGIREWRKLRSHTAIRSMASIDPLTGVMNRRSFSISIDEELGRMARTGKAAAVILFDLDRFKDLNDQFGHHVGDEVLTKIAAIAYCELRNPFDRLARWGGEEFIILLHDMTEETARSVCERLRTRIEDLLVEHDRGQVMATASFGGSLLLPYQDFQEALHHADEALYRAKANGRNRVEFKRVLRIAV